MKKILFVLAAISDSGEKKFLGYDYGEKRFYEYVKKGKFRRYLDRTGDELVRDDGKTYSVDTVFTSR